MSGDEHDGDLNDIGEHSGGDDNLNPDADDKADADDNADAAAVGEVSGARWVDVSALPGQVADAIELLIGQAVGDGPVAADITGPRVSRERLGDVIQAAETVKAFGDASLLGATAALVEDVAVDHGVPADDPRFAAKVAVYRKQACRAVVHEVQLLTGSTLTSARDRVRFATALRNGWGGRGSFFGRVPVRGSGRGSRIQKQHTSIRCWPVR